MMIDRLPLIVLLVIALFAQSVVSLIRHDCCRQEYTLSGSSCGFTASSSSSSSTGSTSLYTRGGARSLFQNVSTEYFCVQVADSCTSCALAVNITSSECYQCCATSSDDCGIPFSYITTSSWSKYRLILLPTKVVYACVHRHIYTYIPVLTIFLHFTPI